mmetsp:Transcript_8762/g.13152  ORF Transcript_8762/g.13152 Transcript_8762/m.13152 type:complete len:109 (+) Transcript_8762:32-358(+)
MYQSDNSVYMTNEGEVFAKKMVDRFRYSKPTSKEEREKEKQLGHYLNPWYIDDKNLQGQYSNEIFNQKQSLKSKDSKDEEKTESEKFSYKNNFQIKNQELQKVNQVMV